MGAVVCVVGRQACFHVGLHQSSSREQTGGDWGVAEVGRQAGSHVGVHISSLMTPWSGENEEDWGMAGVCGR